VLGFPRYIVRISVGRDHGKTTGGKQGLASEVRQERRAEGARLEDAPVVGVVEPADAARSQSEAAYLRIRDRIVSLDMPPGSVVEEARLREELEIGRTPIREALQRLALENLVRSIPHRGTFVTDVNITDLARITEVRVVLESHAARLAAERIGPADRAGIQELVEILEAGGATEQRELMRLDQRIHRQIYRAARNSFLEATLERYLNLSLRLWYLVLDHEVRLREAVVEHVELLHAVLAGDGSRAEDSMRRHIAGFEREIRKVLVER
jgi:DNA-binding GntR family transcriptional regulator